MNVQEMDYKLSQYFNPNVQTWPLIYQSIYNRMFQKVLHRQGESEINYINIFHDDKALEISVGNIYTEYQLMHTFLDNFHQG